VGFAFGVALVLLILLVAAQMYGDAIANGRDGEAGFWAWLRLSF
jgi:hypothetical protein